MYVADANTPLGGRYLEFSTNQAPWLDKYYLVVGLATVQADVIALKQDNNTLTGELNLSKTCC